MISKRLVSSSFDAVDLKVTGDTGLTTTNAKRVAGSRGLRTKNAPGVATELGPHGTSGSANHKVRDLEELRVPSAGSRSTLIETVRHENKVDG